MTVAGKTGFVEVALEDGRRIQVLAADADRIRGVDADGDVVMPLGTPGSPHLHPDGSEYLIPVTPCCHASGKGSGDVETGVVCRTCYCEVDGKYGGPSSVVVTVAPSTPRSPPGWPPSPGPGSRMTRVESRPVTTTGTRTRTGHGFTQPCPVPNTADGTPDPSAHQENREETLVSEPISVWETPSLVFVDPRTLLVDGNSREIKDIREERPDLVDNITQFGVNTPPTANPAPGGKLRIRHGFSRTVAAVAALDDPDVQFDTIPVFVVAAGEEDEAARLIDQMNENNIRKGYTETEQAENVERLTLFGLTVDEIVGKLSTSPDRVQAALTVRKSKAATAALASYTLTMEQAAELAQFEHDEEAYGDLMDSLDHEPKRFEHKLERWKLEYETRALCEQLAEQLRADGVTVVGFEHPGGAASGLSGLRRSATDSTLLDSDSEAHTFCPGHAAYVTSSSYTGKAWPVYLCLNWTDHGHIAASWAHKSDRPKPDLKVSKANNTAWRAAEKVRRAKVTKLLLRKTPPPQVHQWIAKTLILGGKELITAIDRRHGFACELLGLKEYRAKTPHPLMVKLTKATNAEATMVTLAMLLCAVEASTSVDTWKKGHATDAQKRYFETLEEWKVHYLDEVERLVFVSAEAAAVTSTLEEPGDVADDHDTDAEEELDANAPDDIDEPLVTIEA